MVGAATGKARPVRLSMPRGICIAIESQDQAGDKVFGDSELDQFKKGNVAAAREPGALLTLISTSRNSSLKSLLNDDERGSPEPASVILDGASVST